ncbi:MAG: hypothetical protein KIG91_05300 [Treponema sp.]|nr:hypothetical protein [Treponema sp.]
MKLDPIFEVKNNSLFLIADGSAVNPSSFSFVEFNQSDIELDEEVYNEETLAAWREEFLVKAEKGEFVVLAPHASLDLTNVLNFERFCNTCNHTARRVKDCKSVAGFLFDETFLSENAELRVADFIELLAKKHAQYVYFVQKSVAEKLKIGDLLHKHAIVVY